MSHDQSSVDYTHAEFHLSCHIRHECEVVSLPFLQTIQ